MLLRMERMHITDCLICCMVVARSCYFFVNVVTSARCDLIWGGGEGSLMLRLQQMQYTHNSYKSTSYSTIRDWAVCCASKSMSSASVWTVVYRTESQREDVTRELQDMSLRMRKDMPRNIVGEGGARQQRPKHHLITAPELFSWDVAIGPLLSLLPSPSGHSQLPRVREAWGRKERKRGSRSKGIHHHLLQWHHYLT